MSRGTVATCCLALMVAFLGCAKETAKPDDSVATMSRDAKGRPSARAFFLDAGLSQVSISPDSRHIVGISRKGDTDIVVVQDTQGGPPQALAKLVRDRSGAARTVVAVGWASDETVWMAIEFPWLGLPVEARKSRLMVVDLADRRVRYLGEDWRDENMIRDQSRVVDTLPDDPEHLLLNLRYARAHYPGIQRVNVRTGAISTLQASRWGVLSWYLDHRGEVRAGEGIGKERGTVKEGSLTGVLVARERAEDEFQEVARWVTFDEDGLSFAGFSADPEQIYVVAPSEDGKIHRIHEYDLSKRELGALVFEHPEVDANSVVTSKLDGRPLYVPYADDRPEMYIMDRKWKRLQTLLDQALPNRTNRIVSTDRNETVFVVRSSSDVVPPEHYLLREEDGSLTLLFRSHPELDSSELAPMRPIQYSARDGLTIHGYLTRPRDSGDRPMPTIVLPHGGPWSRDVWSWDSIVQFLASRGFAVFQPNFRGSTGYGERFEQLGWGQWGLAMQDDITDGVHWLIEQGLADPERIGIFGISYGGYAALQGLVSTPDLYRAGASFAGVADLRVFRSDDNLRFRHHEYLARLIGERRDDKAQLIASSPAQNADKIRVPVLLGHGTRDARVDVQQARIMARELRKHDVPVELHIYENELHWLIDDRNQADFMTKLVGFFKREMRR